MEFGAEAAPLMSVECYIVSFVNRRTTSSRTAPFLGFEYAGSGIGVSVRPLPTLRQRPGRVVFMGDGVVRRLRKRTRASGIILFVGSFWLVHTSVPN